MEKRYIGDQGEISIFRIGALPEAELEAVKPDQKGTIISHSESGSHHVLEDGEVLERKSGVADGMKVFYAMINKPTRLFQDAGDAHGQYDLEPGIYEFRIAREYDPFAEQARQVAD